MLSPWSASAQSGELRFTQQGASVSSAAGLGLIGDDLMLELGGEAHGIRSLNAGAYLLQWDGLVAGKGGYLASTHPFTLLAGGVAHADGEAGLRLLPAAAWSPYGGARFEGLVQWMGAPGGNLTNLNNSDGLGGLTAHVLLRMDLGLSYLDPTHSLLLVGFLQGSFQAAEENAADQTLLGGGAAVRFDIAPRLTAELELSLGKSPGAANRPLHLTEHTSSLGLAAQVRKTFGSGLWVGAAARWNHLSQRTVYSTGTAFSTAPPSSIELSLSLGIPIGRQG
jgi:hypothetical protein